MIHDIMESEFHQAHLSIWCAPVAISRASTIIRMV